MTYDEKLDLIIEMLAGLGAVKSGPFAGQTPGAPETFDLSTADPVLAALGDLGGYGPSAHQIARLLAHGYTADRIIAEANALLDSTGKPSRVEAAYALAVSSHGVGWKMFVNRVEGKPENPIVSHDPANDLLAGISTANGPSDFAAVADVVKARAEEGVTWKGTRALEGNDLAAAKEALLHPRAEWLGWYDQTLLRVLVLTNMLPAKWEGSNLFQKYPDVTVYCLQTLPEYLYSQWLANRGGGQ
jgi:hypothetical protein